MVDSRYLYIFIVIFITVYLDIYLEFELNAGVQVAKLVAILRHRVVAMLLEKLISKSFTKIVENPVEVSNGHILTLSIQLSQFIVLNHRVDRL